MKKKLMLMTAAIAFMAAGVSAQENNQIEVPKKVSNIEILDLNGNPTKLPGWGEKNLLIFYVDPDHHKQNEDFTYELEENKRASSEKIQAYGILNLKDAPFVPNGMARNLAKKRTEKNGATVLADQQRTLSTEWGLGKCNNQFVLLFVSKEGELVFVRKGELTAQDKEAFYEMIEHYK